MKLRTVIFCLGQVGALALIIGAASLVVSLVGFSVQMLHGLGVVRAASFAAFMFLWMCLIGLTAASALALTRLRSRTKAARISLDELARLPRAERIALQKKYGI